MTQENPLFQEIDEDLERQKFEAMWKRYGALVIVGAVAIVVATAGYTMWENQRTTQEQKTTDALVTILQMPEGADLSKKVTALEDFAKGSHGATQATLARLHAAELTANDGDRKQAVGQYDAIAGDTSTKTEFRQLADLLAVQQQMDSGDPPALQKRLQPLLAENSPWRYSAMEETAFLALRGGERAKAKEIFNALARDTAAPASITERAADMARTIE